MFYLAFSSCKRNCYWFQEEDAITYLEVYCDFLFSWFQREGTFPNLRFKWASRTKALYLARVGITDTFKNKVFSIWTQNF